MDSLYNELLKKLRSGSLNAGDKKVLVTNWLRGTVPDKASIFDDNLSEEQMSKCGLGLPVDASKCAEIMEKCANGMNASCASAWSGLAFEGGIDTSKLDNTVAKNLLMKLGVSFWKTGCYDEWVQKLSTIEKDTPSERKISDSVKAVVKALVTKVNENSNVATSSPTVLQRRAVIPSGLYGGGVASNNLSEIKQITDYLKNQKYTMIGGDPLVVTSKVRVLKAQFHNLKKALKARGKTIDENDEKQIWQLLDSLERTEQKEQLLVKYMVNLRKLLNAGVLDSESKVITTDLIDELMKKNRKLFESGERKSMNILSIYDSLKEAVEQNASAIKSLAERLPEKAVAPVTAPVAASAPETDLLGIDTSSRKY